MLAIASEPILNLADTAMIGHLGVVPLAAKAIASALIGGIYWVFTFLIFGTTTLIGYHHGAGENEACGDTCFHALFLAVLGGVFVSAVAILFAADFYRLMGADESVLQAGVPYFRTRIAGAPFTFVFYATVGFLRGIQNTRLPLIVAVLANSINLVLDYALIYGRLGFPAIGLQGAGIAAFIAQLIGAATCIAILRFSPVTAPYRPSRRIISFAKLLPLFRIGRDLAVRTGALRFSLVFATGVVARMGSAVLSAHEIAFQLFLLSSDVIDGLAVAGQALAAKYLGSHRRDAAYRMGRVLIFYGSIAGLLFAVVFFGAKTPLVELFTKSPEVALILGGGIFVLLAIIQPINGIVFVLDGFLIGAHDTRFLMKAMLVGAVGMFVPVSWCSLHWNLGLAGVWTGLGLLMLFRLTTNLYRFFGTRWATANAAPSGLEVA
jgi:putative MATE family efflux protein